MTAAIATPATKNGATATENGAAGRQQSVPAGPQSGLRFGRIPITNVQPVLEGGKFPAKGVRGADVRVSAVVFREGHDLLGVTAILFAPDGSETQRTRLAAGPTGSDSWLGVLTPAFEGDWSFAIEGWSDRYATWAHNAQVKINADVDVDVMLAEGAELLHGAAKDTPEAAAANVFKHAAKTLADDSLNVIDRLAAGTSASFAAEHVLRYPKDAQLREQR